MSKQRRRWPHVTQRLIHARLSALLSTMTPASVFTPGIGWQDWTPELGYPPGHRDAPTHGAEQ